VSAYILTFLPTNGRETTSEIIGTRMSKPIRRAGERLWDYPICTQLLLAGSIVTIVWDLPALTVFNKDVP